MKEVESDSLTLIFINMVYVTEMLGIIDFTVTRSTVIRLKCHHAGSGYSCGGGESESAGWVNSVPKKGCHVHPITITLSLSVNSHLSFGFYTQICDESVLTRVNNPCYDAQLRA